MNQYCIGLAVLLGCMIPQSYAVEADLVVTNANVITIDDEHPRADAFAVLQGKIIAVGFNGEIEKLVGDETERIDAGGQTITPGFDDAHIHPRAIYPMESRMGKVDVNPGTVNTIEELIDAIKDKAAITPPGQWITGGRYQDTKLGRHPTRFDLDQATTKHPVYLTHSSGHVAVVNTLALRRANVNQDTPDPAGGGFDRDETGEPNGVLRESAKSIVSSAGQGFPKATHEEELEGLFRCFEEFVAEGITSVQVAGVSPRSFRLFQDAVERGLPSRVTVMFRERYLPDLQKLNLSTGFGNDRFKLGGIKMFHGNSLSGRTCWLYEPYAGRPDYYGIPPALSQVELNELIHNIHQAGFQASVHSNGDREIDMVLDAFEYALEKTPKENHRLRIEHASVCNLNILARVKNLQVVLALHSYVYEHGDKMEEYGESRWGMMHPNQSALEMGIPVAGNSDYPVSAAIPLLRIQSLATRTSAEGKVYGEKQKVSVEDAIRIFTLGSAYASFDENVKGSIEVGKYADFVVLADDPTAVSVDQIKDISVVATYIGGKVVYQR